MKTNRSIVKAGVIAIAALAFPVVTQAASPDPAFLLTGTIVDASGVAVVPYTAKVVEAFTDGTIYEAAIHAAADGTWSVALVPAGTVDAPVTVTVTAYGTPLPNTTDAKGCIHTAAPVGVASISISGVAPAAPIAVVINAVGDLQVICPESASPTVPPTDAAPPGGPSGDAPGAGLIAAVAGLGGLALVAVARRERVRGR